MRDITRRITGATDVFFPCIRCMRMHITVPMLDFNYLTHDFCKDADIVHAQDPYRDYSFGSVGIVHD